MQTMHVFAKQESWEDEENEEKAEIKTGIECFLVFRI